MRIGIIGVGLMGQGIARNVMLKGGFALNFLDHPGNQSTDEIVSLGAQACATPAEVAAASDVVIICVTGSAQVEQIMTGPSGVMQTLRAGATVVDCSTALPDSTVRLAGLVQAAGGRFLDAPMTRTSAHAHEGTLNLLVGGDLDVLAQIMPVLDSFTENVSHVGDVGAGHRMKLLHNYVSIGFMTLLGEAAAQAADGGVDPGVFVDVLAKGGGASAALDRLAPFITDTDTSGLPFFIGNALKDIDYYREMTRAADAQQTVADGVATALRQTVEAGHGEAYLPELVALFGKG
jgi:3-hydroxyisobutyrate dehydrogenase-like beta-hydroxyacid dehydrogenase